MKNTVIVGVIALVVGLAIGRYSLPAKIEVKTETQIVDHKQDNVQTETKDQSVTTVTVRPDGSKVTETHNNIVVSQIDKSKDTTATKSESDTVTTYSTNRWGLSVIGAMRPLSAQFKPIYGGEISYRILGPFEIGAIGLQDGTIGIKLGLVF